MVPNPIFFALKMAVLRAYNKHNKGNKKHIFQAPESMWEQNEWRVKMLFQKNKNKKTELLLEENIKTNCTPDTKENVIRSVGKMLVESGYVTESYVDGMVEREKSFSTYMGNSLALPHGVEAAKKEIKSSGIAVMIFQIGRAHV